ncbi:MAG: hypothetical protein Q9219_003716 [cf. Caloplaca sp. 3 TL-2023]
MAETKDIKPSEGSPDGYSEKRKQSISHLDDGSRNHLNAVFENPFADIPDDRLMRDVEQFCHDNDMMDDLEDMKKGALVSKHPRGIDTADFLSEEEKESVRREKTHKWDHPWMLFWLCSCWLNEPLNRVFARRGTIFISCFIAAAASIWEAFTYSWQQLFVARFVLGLGIGTKSATVPVYAAECAPAPIRGALVMQWQVWTAFGIMVSSLDFRGHLPFPVAKMTMR